MLRIVTERFVEDLPNGNDPLTHISSACSVRPRTRLLTKRAGTDTVKDFDDQSAEHRSAGQHPQDRENAYPSEIGYLRSRPSEFAPDQLSGQRPGFVPLHANPLFQSLYPPTQTHAGTPGSERGLSAFCERDDTVRFQAAAPHSPDRLS